MSTDAEKDMMRKQIYERMNFKETGELLEIWRKGDREEWTESAFDVIKEILLDRLGEIPPEEEKQGVSVSAQNKRAYHSEKKLLLISSWANILSWIVLVLYITIFIVRVVLEIQKTIMGIPFNLPQIYSWLGIFSSLIFSLIYFLLLQAISKGISMLIKQQENGFQTVNVGKQ